MSSAYHMVAEIFNTALKAVDPYESVKIHIDRIISVYQNGHFKRLIVIGFGKAACLMAKGIEDNLSDLVVAGVIITKYGHSKNCDLKKIMVIEAGHPLPDKNGLKGTNEIIRLLKSADEKTLVVCLISGGGSALLVSPYKGITLAEKQLITKLLLNAGADINDLNTIRKHISNVKGGRLAELAYPAKTISLILSDVIGDRLDMIASGPTSPDKTIYKDTLKILEKYKLMDKFPEKILGLLQMGENGLIPETPKEENKIFENVENIIIGSSKIALDAARLKAEEMGFHVEILSSELTGEAREVGKWFADKVKGFKSVRVEKFENPLCLISSGETTVTVRGNGTGGRNMELALSFAMEIEGMAGITLLSAGTDGTDGPTDAAGAIVNGDTIKKARAIGLVSLKYLQNNDSYAFFEKTNNLFITGATGTNVMDIQIVVIE